MMKTVKCVHQSGCWSLIEHLNPLDHLNKVSLPSNKMSKYQILELYNNFEQVLSSSNSLRNRRR